MNDDVEIEDKLIFTAATTSHIITNPTQSVGYDVSSFNTLIMELEGPNSIINESTTPGEDARYIEGKLQFNVDNTAGTYVFPVGGNEGLEAVDVTLNSGITTMKLTGNVAPPTTVDPLVNSKIVYYDVGNTTGQGILLSAVDPCDGATDGIKDKITLNTFPDFGWQISMDAGSLNSTTYNITFKPEITDFSFTPLNPSTVDSDCLNDKLIYFHRGGIPGGISGNAVTGMLPSWPSTTGYDLAPINAVTSGSNQEYTLLSQPGFSFFGGATTTVSGTALPVELLYLTATEIDNEYIQLNWATTSEINNDGFEIQRSIDAQNFQVINWVEGNGNAATVHNYELNDYDAQKNQPLYYRLKQIDFNGNYDYSTIVSASLEEDNNVDISIYPNPATDQLTIKIEGTTNEVYFALYDAIGKRIIDQTFSANDKEIIQLGALSNGLYTITITNGQTQIIEKLIIE